MIQAKLCLIAPNPEEKGLTRQVWTIWARKFR